MPFGLQKYPNIKLFIRWIIILSLLLISMECSIALSSSPTGPVPGGAERQIDLSTIYKEIAKKAIDLDDGESWPKSENFLSMLPRDKDTGYYCVPRFSENDGPLMIAAIIDRQMNDNCHQILKECDKAFVHFCDILQNKILTTTQIREDFIWNVPSGTHHICITVFQEHPSLLLNDEEKKLWHPVDNQLVATELFQNLSNYQTSKCLPPRLVLDSLLLTQDGAMIAGFVDSSSVSSYSSDSNSNTCSRFHKIRYSAMGIAKSVLGSKLTSRPKNLIHVTIGRVLKLPNELSSKQKKAIIDLVKDFNENQLPQVVKALHESISGGAFFDLFEITLLRDIVWTLREIKEFASWRLKEKEEESK